LRLPGGLSELVCVPETQKKGKVAPLVCIRHLDTLFDHKKGLISKGSGLQCRFIFFLDYFFSQQVSGIHFNSIINSK
jgi:hypothetical protein